MIAAGPFNFADGESVVIGFALLGGEGFNDLLANTDAAKNLWDTRIVTSVEDLPGSALPSTKIREAGFAVDICEGVGRQSGV